MEKKAIFKTRPNWWCFWQWDKWPVICNCRFTNPEALVPWYKVLN